MSGRCTPGCRVASLTAKVLEKLRADNTPVTAHTFKRKLDYYANDHKYISKEGRKELKRQVMRHWLLSITNAVEK